MGIKRIEKIRTEEIRVRAGATNISEKNQRSESEMVERKREEDVVKRKGKMEVSGH